MDNIKKDVLYLLRVDFDSFIVCGHQLELTLRSMRENQVIEVSDIADNYLLKPYTKEVRISYQELYKIKTIILQ